MDHTTVSSSQHLHHSQADSIVSLRTSIFQRLPWYVPVMMQLAGTFQSSFKQSMLRMVILGRAAWVAFETFFYTAPVRTAALRQLMELLALYLSRHLFYGSRRRSRPSWTLRDLMQAIGWSCFLVLTSEVARRLTLPTASMTTTGIEALDILQQAGWLVLTVLPLGVCIQSLVRESSQSPVRARATR